MYCSAQLLRPQHWAKHPTLAAAHSDQYVTSCIINILNRTDLRVSALARKLIKVKEIGGSIGGISPKHSNIHGENLHVSTRRSDIRNYKLLHLAMFYETI